MNDKLKTLITFLVTDLFLYLVFCLQGKSFVPAQWDYLDALNFNAYLVFNFCISVFYYISKKI